MTDRSFQRANAESRERLARLVATLTPAQMAIDVGGGWTVASVLAHLGFFDRFHAERWTEMLAGRWSADDESLIAAEHLALKALDPYWAGMDSPDLSNLALEATARLDALIANAPNATVDAIERGVAAYLLHRHRHRGEHIDQIERSIVAAESAAESAAPTVDRSFVERNAESRRRLADLVGRLTTADMARDTAPSEEGSWNVAQVLGHLAFWDRSMETRWIAAKEAAGERGAFEPASLPSDVADAVNLPLATLLGAWTAHIGVDVGAQALAAAESLDALLVELVDMLPAGLTTEKPHLVNRWLHREPHLAAVEAAISGSSVPRA
jgi:uncharacterized damage-inducible protein DinB